MEIGGEATALGGARSLPFIARAEEVSRGAVRATCTPGRPSGQERTARIVLWPTDLQLDFAFARSRRMGRTSLRGEIGRTRVRAVALAASSVAVGQRAPAPIIDRTVLENGAALPRVASGGKYNI